MISFGCMSLNIGQVAKTREHITKSMVGRAETRDKGHEIKETGNKGNSDPAEKVSLEKSYNENQRLLHRAIDMGVNYFDTADLYNSGENEILVGKALRSKRQGIFLATKVGNQMRPDGSGWDWNPSKKYILEAVEDSLRRLQTDYIDLYQLHGGTIEDPIDETIEAFEILKEQGKIRAYGISSIRPNVIRQYVKRSNIVSVMMQYSLLDRRPEENCLPLLQEHQIGVMVRGAVAKGLLAGKPSKSYLGYQQEDVEKLVKVIGGSGKSGTRDEGRGTKEEGRGTKDNEGRGTMDEARGKHDEVLAIKGPRSSPTPAQIAIQFALRGPAVCSVVAGMRTLDQLTENIGAVSREMLSDERYRQLSSVLPPNVYEAHR